jgi:hypothetical protein
MSIHKSTLTIAVAFTLLVSAGAWPKSEDYISIEQHTGDIAWISGGVGKDQADAMLAVASRYNLRLILAEARKPRAAFLCDVTVKISDAAGRTILETHSGPLLFVKLPAGRYILSAKTTGQTITRSVLVKKKAQKVIALIWPESVG